MIFHENLLPADNSHEKLCLICYFWKSSKILNCRLLQIIGCALRVKEMGIHHSSKKCELLRLNMAINSACWVIFHAFSWSANFFFKINYFKKFFQEYHQSVKQFGSRSGPTFCLAWSGSKLFTKVSVKEKKVAASKKRNNRHIFNPLYLPCLQDFYQDGIFVPVWSRPFSL